MNKDSVKTDNDLVEDLLQKILSLIPVVNNREDIRKNLRIIALQQLVE